MIRRRKLRDLEKPPIAYTDSRHIPVGITRYVLWRDGPFCVCGCGEVGKEFDHCPAWNLLEPKRHDPDKIFLRGKRCHRKKSGQDTTDAAKVKRVGRKHRGEKKASHHKIVNRGFDKTKTKKFNGTVVPRNA